MNESDSCSSRSVTPPPLPVYDLSHLPLHADHERRPCWVFSAAIAAADRSSRGLVIESCTVLLEAHGAAANSAVTQFLIAIAEPHSRYWYLQLFTSDSVLYYRTLFLLFRPLHIHEYSITRNSLAAAVSLGLSGPYIVHFLKKFAKVSRYSSRTC